MKIKNNPLFSILVANYNNGKYIKETVSSVLNQTYTNWQIIIVDDCSTDNSIEIIRSYLFDNRILLYKNETNKKTGYTKRKCVEKATGELCAFLDPDDTITPNAIEIMVNAHKLNPNVSVISSNHYLCDEHLNITGTILGGQIPEGQTQLTYNGSKITHFATFKRSLYNKTKGINANLKRAVDQDLYYKLEEVGKTLYLNEFLYYYRIHNQGLSTLDNEVKAYYWRMKVNEKAFHRRYKKEITYKKYKKEIFAPIGIAVLNKSVFHFSQKEFIKGYLTLAKSMKYIMFDKKIVLRFHYSIYPLKQIIKKWNH